MAPSEPDPQPDPERARRTRARLLWSCAVFTVLIGAFQLSRVLDGANRYDVLAWIGVVVSGLCLLALTGVYVACALERTSLKRRVVGQFDLFQLTTGVMVIAVVTGVAGSNTTALALLLPLGLTYWLHNLPTSGAP